MFRLFMSAATIAASLPSIATSQDCKISVAGTTCVAVTQAAMAPGPVAVGETIKRGAYSMLLNASYYGLPNVSDGWVYMRIENDVYRVDWNTHQVLERVTDQTSANW